jgi:ABC-type transport system substrate-binding protein
VLYFPSTEQTWMTWDASVYDENDGDVIAFADSCVRPDKNYDPQPNLCTSWEVSEDGLTWTFQLDESRVWSDGEPITADDMVFTFQRFARPDYDFEWYYSMANITNWGALVSGDVAPEELGVKALDAYTFTVTTDRPTPYLAKIFADLWIVPKDVVKDRLNDGSWAFDQNNWVFAGPYVIESLNKGKDAVIVANPKYTGPFPPMMDKIILNYIDVQARFNAFKNKELDVIGNGYEVDLPPAAVAEVNANEELKKQWVTWPNFITYYLFFDTWNKPFDDLKVRQAFSHAIDRDALVNGPLQYQAMVAYTMNPPGFPGESVEKLKAVQNYDPKLAADLLAQAGFPGGEGFPKLTLFTRAANPALTNAAEGIGGMIKENLGIEVEIQNLDNKIFAEKMRTQKQDKAGDFIFGIVPYEYDIVDGSNLLGVWGGCETEDSPQPGRHPWYSKEYNDLLCEANVIIGDEPKRNELYQQAEQILVSDVALVPIYHGIYNAMVASDLAGPALEPGASGNRTFRRFKMNTSEGQVYRKQ